MPYRLLPCGDAALSVEFGEEITPTLAGQVALLDEALRQPAGEETGIIETVPTFRSLAVIFDPLLTDHEAVAGRIARAMTNRSAQAGKEGRRWNLPAFYNGPDIEDCAAAKGMSVSRLVELHSRSDLIVYMLGFLPGFAFMGDLPEEMAVPRRAEPRLRVAPGTLAMTGRLTAIYPWESPGGWNLLGACPVPLFNPDRPAPALLQPGDRVRFTPIGAGEYADLLAAAPDPGRFLA